MDNKQAIAVIKQAIDIAISKGAFSNLETINQIGQALQHLINEKK